MKLRKLFYLLTFLLVLPLSAQETLHDNRLYFTIGETNDLTKVPLMLHLDNPTTDITAVEAYITMPENIILADGVLCGRAKNHELKEGNVSGAYFVSVASPSLFVVVEGNDVICTWLCDLSHLSDGEYTITAAGMFAVGVDDAGVTSYTVAEQSLTIEIDSNTTAIEEMKEQRAESKEIYDLAGRSVKEITEKGIYIINGKKVKL